VANELDSVARYAMLLGFAVRNRTVLVEGTTDADLFHLAARLERDAGEPDLLGTDLAVVPAGLRDQGGTPGVRRELVNLRAVARTCLLPNGRPQYRFIGLVDNDKAGKQAVKDLHNFDNSILEYKDVFRIWPVMPLPNNLDPGTLQKTFENQNACFKGLEWELEDALAQDFIEAFESECPEAVAHKRSIEGKIHRDFTCDGKARLHRFVKLNAMRRDLAGVVHILKAIRFYFGLK
jgi:hypothetical protein